MVSRAASELAADKAGEGGLKKARLIPIECGNEIDAEGQLLRLTRRFQKEKRGRLVGFVGAFMYREKNGDIRVMNSAHGKIGLDGQVMMARKLVRWIEEE